MYFDVRTLCVIINDAIVLHSELTCVLDIRVTSNIYQPVVCSILLKLVI